jgi:predicted MPP superfamily phosphohydrolase
MIFIRISELVRELRSVPSVVEGLQAAELVIGAAGLGALWLLALRVASAARRRRAGETSTARSTWLPLLIVLAGFCALDGLLLWSLPHLRISYAPDSNLSLALILTVRLLLLGVVAAVALVGRIRSSPQGQPASGRLPLQVLLVTNVLFSLALIDGHVVEPAWVQTTELSLAFDDLDPAAGPIRVVYVADPHVARIGVREETVIRRVKELAPDLIVFNGDFLDLSYLQDPAAADEFRRFAAELHAPYGLYGVRGTVEGSPASMARVVEGTDIVWLEGEAVTVEVRGQRITLVGVPCSHDRRADAPQLLHAMEGVADDDFTLLLYHSPDLIYEAAELGIDLELGGHTHGGQIRVPFYGAIVTLSEYGRRFASGLFQVDGTTLYVSRGLGLEGGHAPRVRFLCRPELVSLELVGR